MYSKKRISFTLQIFEIIIRVIIKQSYPVVSPFSRAASSGLCIESFINLVPIDLPKWKPSPRWTMKRLKGKPVLIVWQCVMLCTKLVSSSYWYLNNNQVKSFNLDNLQTWGNFILRNYFLSAAKSCNTMNWPRGAAIWLIMLALPLTNAVYLWSGQCECAPVQK